jgi:hypothetical protein
VSDDDDRLISIVVQHSDLVVYAQVSAAVIDNPNRPDWLRADAQEFYDQCSAALLYENDPSKRVRLRPLSFHVRGFYANMVAETLARLGDDVEDQPAQVHMARETAGLVDNDCYSTDFRLDALNALEAVLKSLEPTTLSVVSED